jgi:hypothetical protein
MREEGKARRLLLASLAEGSISVAAA